MKRFQTFHENGLPCEYGREDENGRQGLVTKLDEQGNLFIEAHYKNGEVHGLFTRYHPSGLIAVQTHYNYGQHDGPGVSYYENGLKEEEWEYRNGAFHPINYWHEDGTQTLINGTGNRRLYLGICGSLEIDEYYENGKKIKEVQITFPVYGKFTPFNRKDEDA
ncbi:MAG: hypothetical protein U0T75_10975 [Chitinophagales bacterium]